MDIIDRIFTRSEFSDEPPVLIDIGSFGAGHPNWRRIARYSICVAFDPNYKDRGDAAPKTTAGFMKLYTFKSIVTPKKEAEVKFYNTRAPSCSSVLMPDFAKLENWELSPRFEIINTETFASTTLPEVLSAIKKDRVDWFKTDSQGLDLALFQSIGEDMMKKVMVADFEPGIIDAYRGEDKLWQLMEYMDKIDLFWMADMKVMGPKRLAHKKMPPFSRLEKFLLRMTLRPAPGWAEVSYLRSYNPAMDLRETLFLWVVSFLKGHYAHAYEIALDGRRRFDDPIMKELERCSIFNMRLSYLTLPFILIKKLISFIK